MEVGHSRRCDGLQALLNLFEIVVLPDGLGGYSHNVTLFLLDEYGRIVRAYGIDRPDAAALDDLPLVKTTQFNEEPHRVDTD